MGYLGRRIGKSQTTANPQADGNTGGILDLFSGGYFQRTGNMPNYVAPPPQGLTATGGVISDYTDGPAVYRAHVFTSSGTFTVTAPGIPSMVILLSTLLLLVVVVEVVDFLDMDQEEVEGQEELLLQQHIQFL
jgi:hypothetical protein